MKYFMLFSLLFLSCNSTHKIEKQAENNSATILLNEGPWKSNFKNMVFSNILSRMYGKEFIECCLKHDASGTANYDWLNYDTVVSKKITQIADSFVARYASGTDIEGVPVRMNFALEFRLSHELDSITGMYYRQYKNDSTLQSRNEN